MFDQERHDAAVAFLKHLGFEEPKPTASGSIIVGKFFPAQEFTIYVRTGFVQGNGEVRRKNAFVCGLKCKHDKRARLILKCKRMSGNWQYNWASQISKLEHLMSLAPKCVCGATMRLIVNPKGKPHKIFWACSKGSHNNAFVYNVPHALEIALLPEIDEE